MRLFVTGKYRDYSCICEAPLETQVGVNERELILARQVDPAKQKIAYYHANFVPFATKMDTELLDRKAGLVAGALLETPAQALARSKLGERTPVHHFFLENLQLTGPKSGGDTRRCEVAS